jgi:hypothetical protein
MVNSAARSESSTPAAKRPVGFTGAKRGLYRARHSGPARDIKDLPVFSRGRCRVHQKKYK